MALEAISKNATLSELGQAEKWIWDMRAGFCIITALTVQAVRFCVLVVSLSLEKSRLKVFVALFVLRQYFGAAVIFRSGSLQQPALKPRSPLQAFRSSRTGLHNYKGFVTSGLAFRGSYFASVLWLFGIQLRKTLGTLFQGLNITKFIGSKKH